MTDSYARGWLESQVAKLATRPRSHELRELQLVHTVWYGVLQYRAMIQCMLMPLELPSELSHHQRR